MVSQEDRDNLFAQPSKAGLHVGMLMCCCLFDILVYPIMIWFLFIDIPAFLRAPPGEDSERVHLWLKIGIVSAFTMVICVYQMILCDLSRQHASRICGCVRRRRRAPPSPDLDNLASQPIEAWDRRPEATQTALNPVEMEAGITVTGAPWYQPTPSHMSTTPSKSDGRLYSLDGQVAAQEALQTHLRQKPALRVETGKPEILHGDPRSPLTPGRLPNTDVCCHTCSSSLAEANKVFLASCGHYLCSRCSTGLAKGSACSRCWGSPLSTPGPSPKLKSAEVKHVHFAAAETVENFSPEPD
eukprot:TRINITY_DN93844_c0_g1_i1.p1 TRINITY_DN93844_c0_g1~~TRINITY_DN93844_c0_g1_i1.p1  ORF type:complete len:299 (-),score=25.95 TRINITY_DN93844_c0_g1_i1:51-947(-)